MASKSGPSDRHAIVVGAGHNGLTTAFYLARAGMAVTACWIDGTWWVAALSPRKSIRRMRPGNRVSTASYMASMLRPEVIRDLELGRHGLKMIAAGPGAADCSAGRHRTALVE